MEADEKKALIEELFERGVEHIYPSVEFLRTKLESGEQLTVYLGADPSSPSLHIGHAIPLRKLALFQKLGHKVIFLLGDFTATIGDPDKLSVRVPLTREQVAENAKLYQSQAARFISFEGENPAQVRSNSSWLDKLTFRDVLDLTAKITFGQIAKRDMFQKRIAEGRDLYLHEFLYPVMQGYDSVAMDVDGEVGGNDQTFNMLVGRDLAKKITGKEKFVLATKLLADAEGIKMGKTTGNMISLTDAPEEMFGKVMSWTDAMIIPGFELCTDIPRTEIAAIKKEIEGGANPRDAKMRLAYEVVKLFHSEEGAEKGKEYFEKTIQHKEIPADAPVVGAKPGPLAEILVKAGVFKSKAEFRRLLIEGALSVHTEKGTVKISEPGFEVTEPCTVKIGKHRFVKIVL